MASAPVKFSELTDAFEFANAGGGFGGDTAAYVSLDTGEIYYHGGDDVEIDDPVPDDLETSDRYVALPDKSELRLGRNLALSFAKEALPDDYSRVAGYFQRSGAYARFKDLLEIRGQLERWYEFERSATERALRAWCEENDIQVVDD